MPQVSDQFGPIFQSVVLDGSGAGTVSFQAVGSNTRITNVFFNVSSSTLQATCTIYKGQIAAGNVVFNSPNGSTGGNASGNVDLFDGETCYVQWTGGDSGATATATFVGMKIPFGDMKPSELTFDNPFAASDGTIVFPALKSPNYVPGVSGWMIARTGSVEFGDAIIRGSVSADNGNITLDDNGLIIIGPTMKFVMDQVGFTITEIPPLGGGLTLVAQAGQGGLIFFQPDDNTITVPAVSYNGGFIFADAIESAGDARPYLDFQSPEIAGKSKGRIQLYGQSDASTDDDSFLNLLTGQGLVWDGYGIDSGKGRVGGGGTNANSAAISTVETVLVTSNAFTFFAGRAYSVRMNGPAVISAAPNRAVVRLRKNGLGGQQLALNGIQFANTGTGNGGWEAIFHVGANDVTCALAWTAIVASGVVTVTYQGASSPTTMDIYDIGTASQTNIDTYTNALV